jgi:hypothetical protein
MVLLSFPISQSLPKAHSVGSSSFSRRPALHFPRGLAPATSLHRVYCGMHADRRLFFVMFSDKESRRKSTWRKRSWISIHTWQIFEKKSSRRPKRNRALSSSHNNRSRNKNREHLITLISRQVQMQKLWEVCPMRRRRRRRRSRAGTKQIYTYVHIYMINTCIYIYIYTYLMYAYIHICIVLV